MVRVRLPFNLVFNSASRFYAAISIRSVDLFDRCMNNADIFLKDGYYKIVLSSGTIYRIEFDIDSVTDEGHDINEWMDPET